MIAKDRNLLGKRSTADTSVRQGVSKSASARQTQLILKTLNPKWNSYNVFPVTLGADSDENLMCQNGGLSLPLNLFDDTSRLLLA
jgi:Ca2+-dependent lipid-binding protein